jgi:hypothetical protein
MKWTGDAKYRPHNAFKTRKTRKKSPLRYPHKSSKILATYF